MTIPLHQTLDDLLLAVRQCRRLTFIDYGLVITILSIENKGLID